MRTRPSPKTERGLAAITAILIVAVAASAAMLMLSQQSAMLDQTMLVASRVQADQYARAGLDWARGILREDARGGAIDTLDEGWAKPIAALPVDRALIAGAIADEQGKFNLNNVVRNNVRSPADMQILGRLLTSLGLAPELADALLDWIDPDDDLTSGGGAESAYYLALRKPYRAANQALIQIEELHRVRGFDAAAIAKLRPHVTALPARTAVNANTASETVLAAVLPNEFPREKIANFIAQRRSKPFKTQAEITAWAEIPSLGERLDVKSAYFSVNVRVAQDDVELATDALVERKAGGATATIWRRPRY